jgi:FkbM family methyltransferase
MIKKTIQNLIRKYGYEINNLSNQEKRRADKWNWLQTLGIETVLDIGANKGQFADIGTIIFPNANIYSFEPLETEYSKLVLNLGGNPRFKAFNIGLGDLNENMDFFISSASPSSSLLPMENLQKKLFPFTAKQTKCKVKIVRLDDFIGEYNLELKPNMLIKIDVQGAEGKVIEGGKKTFGQAQVVLTEINYFRFYKDQPLFKDIVDLLSKFDFTYCGTLEQFYNPKDYLPLFADAFFVKQDLISSILSNATKDRSG